MIGQGLRSLKNDIDGNGELMQANGYTLAIEDQENRHSEIDQFNNS